MHNTQRPLGAMRDPKDERDILFRTLLPALPGVETLPDKVDLRDKMSVVFMQKYGSCVGGTARSAIGYFKILDNNPGEVSDRFLYGRAKEYDGYPDSEGTWPRVMIKVMYGIGAPKLERWPNEPSPTHTEFIAAPPVDVREEAIENVLRGGAARVLNYQELKQSLAKGWPVMITLPVLDTYDQVGPDGLVRPSSGAGNRGLHENLACGYDDNKFGPGLPGVLAKNQWGEEWGLKGYCWLPMNYVPGANWPLTDCWSLNDHVDATGTAGAPVALAYPVETPKPVITQGFGANPAIYAKYGLKGHNGLDFRTKDLKDRYILACDDGEVILAANDGDYGLAVRIKHKWGMSIYGHNSSVLVSDGGATGPGTMVKKGQRIAVPGHTGHVIPEGPAGEHLHFGIRINGVKNPGYFDYVDPSPYFAKDTAATKYFRVQQGGKSGIMVLEGFSGTLLFENDWTEYQTLLKITGGTENAAVVTIPEGKFFRANDHGKLGVLITEGFTGMVLFENDFAEYQTLLKITGLTNTTPEVVIP